jgi:hypothetical protein
MTEEEAKTKWCPIKWRDILTDGKLMFKGSYAKCSASACMMWQWADDGKEYRFNAPTEEGWTFEPYIFADTLQSHDRWSHIKADRKGCCGLARRTL